MLCDFDSVISLNSHSLHSCSLNIEFPIARAATMFGLPPDCSFFDPATSSHHHASTHGLHHLSDATLTSFIPVLTTACDKTSRGFSDAPPPLPSDLFPLHLLLSPLLFQPALPSPFPLLSRSSTCLSLLCLPHLFFLLPLSLSLPFLLSFGDLNPLIATSLWSTAMTLMRVCSF